MRAVSRSSLEQSWVPSCQSHADSGDHQRGLGLGPRQPPGASWLGTQASRPRAWPFLAMLPLTFLGSHRISALIAEGPVPGAPPRPWGPQLTGAGPERDGGGPAVLCALALDCAVGPDRSAPRSSRCARNTSSLPRSLVLLTGGFAMSFFRGRFC